MGKIPRQPEGEEGLSGETRLGAEREALPPPSGQKEIQQSYSEMKEFTSKRKLWIIIS